LGVSYAYGKGGLRVWRTMLTRMADEAHAYGEVKLEGVEDKSSVAQNFSNKPYHGSGVSAVSEAEKERFQVSAVQKLER